MNLTAQKKEKWVPLSKRTKMVVRASLVGAGLIATFWGVYGMILGSIPEVTTVDFTKHTIIRLPFGVSRMWDVLLAPIFLGGGILTLFTKECGLQKSFEDYRFVDVVSCIAFSFTAGLVISVGDLGLAASIVIALVIGIVSFLVAGLATLDMVILAVLLAHGLVCGLVAIIPSSLVLIFFWERESRQ